MPLANAALAVPAQIDLAPLGRALRACLPVLGAAAQAVGFAGLLWLLVATPGAVADSASVVPLSIAAPH